MNPSLLPVLLVGALLISAATGPRLIRAASPALAHCPRAAVGLLGGGIVIWLISFMSLGPLFAWMVTGKDAADSAGICRKCLESSNPWTRPVFDADVPTAVIMAGPALLIAVAAVVLAVRVLGAEREARRSTAQIRRRSRTAVVRGYRVLIIDDAGTAAFALPARHGGIVLSTGTLEVLSPAELDAVLAHERAHLAQHHHLIAAISRHVAQIFRPIPAITAAAAAIPLCLEIAADNAARSEAGTRALVSALLQLSSRRESVAAASVPAAALHAAGPDRFRTLVSGAPSTRGRTTVIATSAQNVALVILSLSVAFPWLAAMASGCA